MTFQSATHTEMIVTASFQTTLHVIKTTIFYARHNMRRHAILCTSHAQAAIRSNKCKRLSTFLCLNVSVCVSI